MPQLISEPFPTRDIWEPPPAVLQVRVLWPGSWCTGRKCPPHLQVPYTLPLRFSRGTDINEERIFFRREETSTDYFVCVFITYKRYRVFIKYCVYSLKLCDFSELCQFCCSAGVPPAWCVYTHWHRAKTEKYQSPEYFKILGKNTIFNEHPAAPIALEHLLPCCFTCLKRNL